jgi:mono/diheme cytochrome c family protein
VVLGSRIHKKGKMKSIPLRLLIRTGMAALILLALAPFSTAQKDKKDKASPSAAALKEGEAVYKKNCEMCHFADKTDKKLAPGLKGLFKNKELPQSYKPATEATIREQIEKGNPDAKPMPMPPFGNKLSPEEMQNLLDYLKTL